MTITSKDRRFLEILFKALPDASGKEVLEFIEYLNKTDTRKVNDRDIEFHIRAFMRNSKENISQTGEK